MNPILDSTLPTDRRARRRVIIGIVLWLSTLTTGLIVMALTNGLPLVGQVAWAGDVDKKVKEAIDPIKTEVTELKQTLAQNTRISKGLLASVTASQIRAINARLCKEKGDAERDRLNGDLDRYLAEYPDYANGNSFPVGSLRCDR